MELRHDDTVDAASVLVRATPDACAAHFKERLHQDRFVRYRDSDDAVLEYAFLNVGCHGVRLDDLEHQDELRALFRAAGFKERGWGAPLSALKVVKRRRALG